MASSYQLIRTRALETLAPEMSQTSSSIAGNLSKLCFSSEFEAYVEVQLD